MVNFILPAGPDRPLSFYLAMEEYVAAAYGCGFFVWRVAPTVIIGRNQDLQSEVNLGFCRGHGIDIVRRKSGGGCVFADKGNVMISYITPAKGVETVFREYLESLSACLRSLGVDAVYTEHNDVLAGGSKVSGNAFFVHPSASIVHGTLLHSVDFDMLQQAITPPAAKLARHSVHSVRQRVVNLVDLGFALPVDALEDALVDWFCDSSRLMAPSEVTAILELEKSYKNRIFDPLWTNS